MWMRFLSPAEILSTSAFGTRQLDEEGGLEALRATQQRPASRRLGTSRRALGQGDVRVRLSVLTRSLCGHNGLNSTPSTRGL